MTKYDRKGTFGILSRKCIGIYGILAFSPEYSGPHRHTSVADASIVDFDSNFVGFWRGNLNILNA